jgi:Ca2+-binding RTX toxin-like protein
VDLTASGLSGTQEVVTLYGEDGRDALWTGSGNDILYGGNGGDWLSGGLGNDTIHGGNSASDGGVNSDGRTWKVNLQAGKTGDFDDVLDGGVGADRLFGGSGNDLLVGGSGTDTVTGGAGADRFAFRAAPGAGNFWNPDIVTDFNHAQGDRLVALDGMSSLTMQNGTMPNGEFSGQACLNVHYQGATVMQLLGWSVSNVNDIGGFTNLWA